MPTSSRSRRPWLVVGTVWVTLAIASGLYFSFPVFFVALLEEFGWSRGATAAAFSISSVVQGALSPMVGILGDRLGPRRVMLGGACLLGAARVLSSRIGSLWSLSPIAGGLAAAEPRAGDRGAGAPRRRRRAADGDVLGALLRLPLHAARRLLGRHPFGGLRGGPRIPAPVRGRHLRAHRSALGRGSDPVRHGRRPHRTRGVGHDLLRLHGGGNALSARTRDLAARGGPVRLRAPLRPRLRRARPHHHRDGVPALPGTALRRPLRDPQRGQRHRWRRRAVVRRRRARPDRELSRRVPDRRRLLRAGLGVLLARAPTGARVGDAVALHAPSSPDRYGRPHWSSYTTSFSGPRPTGPKRPIG